MDKTNSNCTEKVKLLSFKELPNNEENPPYSPDQIPIEHYQYYLSQINHQSSHPHSSSQSSLNKCVSAGPQDLQPIINAPTSIIFTHSNLNTLPTTINNTNNHIFPNNTNVLQKIKQKNQLDRICKHGAATQLQPLHPVNNEETNPNNLYVQSVAYVNKRVHHKSKKHKSNNLSHNEDDSPNKLFEKIKASQANNISKHTNDPLMITNSIQNKLRSNPLNSQKTRVQDIQDMLQIQNIHTDPQNSASDKKSESTSTQAKNINHRRIISDQPNINFEKIQKWMQNKQKHFSSIPVSKQKKIRNQNPSDQQTNRTSSKHKSRSPNQKISSRNAQSPDLLKNYRNDYESSRNPKNRKAPKINSRINSSLLKNEYFFPSFTEARMQELSQDFPDDYGFNNDYEPSTSEQTRPPYGSMSSRLYQTLSNYKTPFIGRTITTTTTQDEEKISPSAPPFRLTGTFDEGSKSKIGISTEKQELETIPDIIRAKGFTKRPKAPKLTKILLKQKSKEDLEAKVEEKRIYKMIHEKEREIKNKSIKKMMLKSYSAAHLKSSQKKSNFKIELTQMERKMLQMLTNKLLQEDKKESPIKMKQIDKDKIKEMTLDQSDHIKTLQLIKKISHGNGLGFTRKILNKVDLRALVFSEDRFKASECEKKANDMIEKLEKNRERNYESFYKTISKCITHTSKKDYINFAEKNCIRLDTKKLEQELQFERQQQCFQGIDVRVYNLPKDNMSRYKSQPKIRPINEEELSYLKNHKHSISISQSQACLSKFPLNPIKGEEIRKRIQNYGRWYLKPTQFNRKISKKSQSPIRHEN